MEQELLQKAMQLRQGSEEAEQQLNFIVQQISELEKFRTDLEELDKSKEKEIVASLGRGVFMKADKKDEKLFVEVGAGIMVRKTPAEARAVIEGQLRKFQEARVHLNQQLQDFALEFQKMLKDVEKIKNKK